MAHNIKVALGTNVKRESVLINPNMTAAEPVITGELQGVVDDNPNKNIIARGTSPKDALKKAYGR